MKNTKSSFPKWNFLVGTFLVSVFAAASVAVLPGCGILGVLGLGPQTLAVGGALVAAGVAGTQNYNVQGSAKNPVDPVNPQFQGVTGTSTLGAGSVRLSWSAASDIGPPGSITYRIFYSTTSSDEATIISQGTQVTTVDATSIDITGLTAGTTYYAVVRAEDASGNTDGNLQRTSVRTFLSFGGVTDVTTLSATSLRASWSAATGAGSSAVTYTAYYSSDATLDTAAELVASGTQATTVDATSVTLSGLSVGTTYSIYVRATTSDNNEGSTVNSVVRSGLTFLSFGGVTSVTTLSATSLQASWSAATGAAASTISYDVYALTSDTIPSTLPAANTSVTGTTTATITGLTAGTTYRILVRARTSDNSEGSTTANAQLISALTFLSFSGASSVTTASSTSLTVNWDAAAGATTSSITYRVYISTSGVADTILATTPTEVAGPATSTTLTGLSVNTAYNVIVRAFTSNNNDGISAATATIRSGRTALTFAGAASASRISIPQTAPSALTRTSSSTLEVAWTAATGAASAEVQFNVYRTADETATTFTPSTTNRIATVRGDQVVTLGTGGMGYRDEGLSDGTRYLYTVRAVTLVGGTATTNEDSNTIAITRRTAPHISGTVTVTNGGTGDFGIFLVASGDTEISYGSFASSITATGDTTATYTIRDVPAGTSFRVRANRGALGATTGRNSSAITFTYSATEDTFSNRNNEDFSIPNGN